ncbi:hypothetical protein CCH79_00018384, partial [Gambusia affinis]
ILKVRGEAAAGICVRNRGSEERRGLRSEAGAEQHGDGDMDPMKAQQLAAELEVEMMADMYNRMTNACHRKCVPPHYKEAELTKGESVCLDRCVAKYLDLHERLGRKLTELSVQDEEMMRKAAICLKVSPAENC